MLGIFLIIILKLNVCLIIDVFCYSLMNVDLHVPFIWWHVLHRFKFDDERVSKEDMKRALEEQYGGEEEVFLSCG